MDFACKKIDIEQILKCAFSLTKKEIEILKFFISNPNNSYETSDLSNELKIDITTSQKACKKLFEKNILNKSQKNLKTGGYVFIYSLSNKKEIKSHIMEIISKWIKNVENEFCNW